MSITWWPERFTISDDAGRARFEVRNIPGFGVRLSLGVAGGEEVAAIRRRRRGRFQVIVRGQEVGLVRQRAADRYDIHSPLGPVATAGDVAGGQYAITSDGTQRATVSRQLVRVDQPQSIGVDIGDDDHAAVLLATILAIEAVRYERGEAEFNPQALLALLNPLNWLRGGVWP